MGKAKIAISVDNLLLKLVDSKVDGSVIRSRSQAIEYYLKRGLQEQSINEAVLLLKGEHQEYALRGIKGSSLLRQQIEFFSRHGIKTVYVITQHTKNMNLLLAEVSNAKIKVEIIERTANGTAVALKAVKNMVSNSFIVMSGDTYNDFDMFKMIKKHIASEKLATMGLMTREKTSSYGTAILDGDLIVDFQEKPKHKQNHDFAVQKISQIFLHHSTNIVNAGIYIFTPEVFEMFEGAISLEKDVFPRLAKIKQLVGFFTYGEYVHVTG